VQSVGTIREWHTEQGWGVIDCPDTPGGCFAHFSLLFHEDLPPLGPGEVREVSGGFREAFEGETVDFDWQPVYPGSQDGYDFVATSVWPRGRPAPHRTIRYYKAGESPYRSG
jgi:CspA family cold shock protein